MKNKKFIVLVLVGCISWLVSCLDTLSHTLLHANNLSDQFGKTHFIVGFPHDELKKSVQQEKPQACQACDVEQQVFFAPDDDVAQALVDLINGEQKEIKVAVYTFTDADIAQALIAAHERGVQISVVTDPGYKADRYSKIPLLKKAGITIYEYNPNYVKDMRSNLMHHKFAVFSCTHNKEASVWTGSFNFTKSARQRNQENAVILKDAKAVERFSKQFDRIKQQRCIRHKHNEQTAYENHVCDRDCAQARGNKKSQAYA